MQRTNQNLKEQNERLIDLNERLMKESESLRFEISQLRHMFSANSNILESQASRSRTPDRAPTPNVPSHETVLQENIALRRKTEELENSLRKIAEQNRNLQTDLENLLKKREPQIPSSHDSGSSKHQFEVTQLKQTISSLQASASLHDQQCREYLSQIEILNKDFKKLSEDHQKIFEENSTLKRKVSLANSGLEEFTRTRISQLEEENKGLSEIVTDLKNRIASSEIEIQNKEKEVSFLREELRQVQGELKSSRGEIIKRSDQLKDKESLITENNHLNSRIDTLTQEIETFKATFVEKDTQILRLQEENNSLKISGIQLTPETLKPLKDEFNRYIKINNTERQDQSKFFDEVLTQVTKITTKFNSHEAHRENQVKDLLKTLSTNLNGHKTSMHKNPALASSESSLLKAINNMKIFKEGDSSVQGQSSRAPSEIVQPSVAVNLDRPSQAGTPVVTQREPAGQVREAGLSNGSDESRLIADLLRRIDGLDVLLVRKNPLTGNYECKVRPSNQESNTQDREAEGVVIQLPGSLLESLKHIEVYTVLSPQTSTPEHRTLIRAEKLLNGQKVVQTLQPIPTTTSATTTPTLALPLPPTLETPLSTHPVPLFSTFPWPTLPSLFSNLFTHLFTLPSKKRRNTLMNVSYYDQGEQREVCSRVEIGEGREGEAMGRKVREEVINRVLSAVSAESVHGLPGKVEIYRQIERQSEVIVERIAVDVKDLNGPGEKTGEVREVISISKSNLRDAVESTDPSTAAISVQRLHFSGGNRINQILSFRNGQRPSLSVQSTTSTAGQPLPRASLDSALISALPLLLPIPTSQLIKESQQGDLVFVDKIDNNGHIQRAEVNILTSGKPSVRSLDSATQGADSASQQWRGKLPLEVIEEVDKAVERRTKGGQLADSELSELINLIVQPQFFERSGHQVVRESLNGANRVYEVIDLISDPSDPSRQLAGTISRSIVAESQGRDGPEWTIQRELPSSKQNFKVVEILTIPKRLASSSSDNSNFSPHPPRTQDKSEVAHQTVSITTSRGESHYYLDLFNPTPELLSSLNKVSPSNLSMENSPFTVLLVKDSQPVNARLYAIPQPGANFVVLSDSFKELSSNSSLEQHHSITQSLLIYHSPQAGSKFILCEEADQEYQVGGGREIELDHAGSGLGYQPAHQHVQEVIRERFTNSQEVVTEKLLIPLAEKSTLISPIQRIISQSDQPLASPFKPRIDFVSILGGSEAVPALFADQNPHSRYVYFVRSSRANMIVDRCEIDTLGHLVPQKTLYLRQKNMFSPAGSSEAPLPSDISIVPTMTPESPFPQQLPTQQLSYLLSPHKVYSVSEGNSSQNNTIALSPYTQPNEQPAFILYLSSTTPTAPIRRIMLSPGGLQVEELFPSSQTQQSTTQGSSSLVESICHGMAVAERKVHRKEGVREDAVAHGWVEKRTLGKRIVDCVRAIFEVAGGSGDGQRKSSGKRLLWASSEEGQTAVRRVEVGVNGIEGACAVIERAEIIASGENNSRYLHFVKESLQTQGHMKLSQKLAINDEGELTLQEVERNQGDFINENETCQRILSLVQSLFPIDTLFMPNSILESSSNKIILSYIYNIDGLPVQHIYKVVEFSNGHFLEEGEITVTSSIGESLLSVTKLKARKNGKSWTAQPIDSSRVQLRTGYSTNPDNTLSAAVRFYTQHAGKGKRGRVLLAEEKAGKLVINVLALSEEAESQRASDNPLSQRAPRYLVTLEEKLFVESRYRLIEDQSKQQKVVHLFRESIAGPKQTIIEEIVIEDNDGHFVVKKLGQRESSLKFQEWLSPVDYPVLSQLFDVTLDTGCAEIIIRRTKDSEGSTYEKIRYFDDDSTQEFSVLESFIVKDSTADSQTQELSQPTIIFNQSNLEDLARHSPFTKIVKRESTSDVNSKLVDLIKHSTKPNSLNNTLSAVSSTNPIGATLPWLLTQKFGPTSRRDQLTRREGQIQRILNLLAEQDHGKGIEFVLAVEMESGRYVGRKVQVGPQGDLIATLVTVQSERSPVGGTQTYGRTTFWPTSSTQTQEVIIFNGDQGSIAQSQSLAAPAFPVPAILAYFFSAITCESQMLRNGGGYLKVSREGDIGTIEVWKTISGGLEDLKERAIIKPDFSTVRLRFLGGVIVEDRLVRLDQAHGKKTATKNGPNKIIQADLTPNFSEVFDQESAMEVFLKDTPIHNFIVLSRVEKDNRIVEKYLVEDGKSVRLADRFIFKLADLARRISMDHVEPATRDALLRKLSSVVDQETIYYVRSVLRDRKSIRQVLKLLKSPLDQNSNEISRLGSSYIIPAEAKMDLEPFLLSRGLFQEYHQSSNEIEYVITREGDGHGSLLNPSSIVGYTVASEPIYKQQLPMTRGARPPSPMGTPSKTTTTKPVPGGYPTSPQKNIPPGTPQKPVSEYNPASASGRSPMTGGRGEENIREPPVIQTAPFDEQALRRDLDLARREIQELRSQLARIDSSPRGQVHPRAEQYELMIRDRDDEISMLRRQIESLISARQQQQVAQPQVQPQTQPVTQPSSANLTKLENANATLTAAIQTLEIESRFLKQQITLLESEKANLHRSLESLTAELQITKKTLLQGQPDTAPLLAQNHSLREELNVVQVTIRNHEATIAQLKARNEYLEAELKKAQLLASEQKSTPAPVQIQKVVDPQSQARIAQLEEQLVEANKTIASLRDTLTRLQQSEAASAELPQLILKIHHLEEELVQARKERVLNLEKIAKAEGELSAARTRIDSLESSITLLSAQRETVTTISSPADKDRIAQLERDLNQARNRIGELESAPKIKETYETPKKDDSSNLLARISALEAELSLANRKLQNLESSDSSNVLRTGEKPAREDITQLQITIESLKGELNKRDSRISTLEGELARAQQQVKLAEGRVVQDPKLQNRITELELELSSAKARSLSPEKNLSQTSEINALKDELAKAAKAKEGLVIDYNNVNYENGELKKQIDSLNSTIKAHLSTISSLKSENALLEEKIVSLREEMKSAENEYRRQAEAAEKRKAEDWLKGENERLKAELDKARMELDRIKDDAGRAKVDSDRWKGDTEKIKTEYERLKRENEELRKELDKHKDDTSLSRAKAEIDRLKGEVDKMRVEVDKYKIEAERVDSENKRLSRELDKAKEDAEKSRVEAEKMRIDIERARSDSERKRGLAGKAQQDLDRLQLDFDRIKGDLDKSRSEHDKLKLDFERIKSDNDKMKPELERLKADNIRLKTESEKPKGDNERLKAENDKLKNDNSKLSLEVDRWKGECDRMKYEFDRVKTEWEKSRFSSERSKTEAEWAVDRIKNDLAESKKQNEALQREINDFKEERHTWSADKEKERAGRIEIDKLRKDIEEYRKRISDLEISIDKARRERDDSAGVQRKARELEEKETLLKRQVEEKGLVVNAKDDKIKDLEMRNDALGRELAAKQSQGHFEEQVLLDMKKKNEFLITEISRLKGELAVLTQKYQDLANRPAPANKYQLTTLTGLNFKDILNENQNRLLELSARGNASNMKSQRDGNLDNSFEGDENSELYMRYMRLRQENKDLYLENDGLKNQNNKLRSDIISLSGKRLNPELVALNCKLILT